MEEQVLQQHRLTRKQLADLASGAGNSASMRTLRDGQLSRQLLLLRHVADAAPGEKALAVLDAARDRNPDAAAWVITDPMISAWTTRAVRKLHRGQPDEADLGQLSALAAVAAARAGVDADLVMTHHDADAMIPTVGLLTGLTPGGTLRLRVRSGRLTVTDGEAARRHELRHLTALSETAMSEPIRSVILDDVSPCRNVFHAPAHQRLPESAAGRWQELVTGGWEILSRHADEQSLATADLVRTIVPLREDESATMRSATARHVFGAVGTTMPSSAAAAAVTLLHEGSHSVLNGVLQLESLFDARASALYFAPWRPDPRPVWGLYHGVFAFLAVAGFMNRMRAEPARKVAAEKQFAKVRAQLRVALDLLLEAPSLTESGRQFAILMEERLARLESVPVSSDATEFATLSRANENARWQKRSDRAE